MRLNFINKIFLSLIALFSVGNLSAAEGASCFGPTKEKEFTANEYISHHLSHCTVDSPLASFILTVFFTLFLWPFCFCLSFIGLQKKQALGYPVRDKALSR